MKLTRMDIEFVEECGEQVAAVDADTGHAAFGEDEDAAAEALLAAHRQYERHDGEMALRVSEVEDDSPRLAALSDIDDVKNCVRLAYLPQKQHPEIPDGRVVDVEVWLGGYKDAFGYFDGVEAAADYALGQAVRHDLSVLDEVVAIPQR